MQTASPPSIPNLPGFKDAANSALTGIDAMGGASANTPQQVLPQIQDNTNSIINNPANQAGAQMGMDAATNNFNTGMNLNQVGSGVIGTGQSTVGQGNTMFAQGNSLVPYAQPIMNAAFDPQNALYNRTFQQNTDQVRAANEARGLDMTPYGAGVENQATSNFNIDWQNNQLQRMIAGAGAASNIYGTAGGLESGGVAAKTAGVGQQTSGANLQLAGANLATPAGQQYSTAANSPANTNIGALNTYANAGLNAQQLPQQTINDYLAYVGKGQQQQSLQLQGQQQQFAQNAQTNSQLGGLASLGALAFL